MPPKSDKESGKGFAKTAPKSRIRASNPAESDPEEPNSSEEEGSEPEADEDSLPVSDDDEEPYKGSDADEKLSSPDPSVHRSFYGEGAYAYDSDEDEVKSSSQKTSSGLDYDLEEAEMRDFQAQLSEYDSGDERPTFDSDEEEIVVDAFQLLEKPDWQIPSDVDIRDRIGAIYTKQIGEHDRLKKGIADDLSKDNKALRNARYSKKIARNGQALLSSTLKVNLLRTSSQSLLAAEKGITYAK
ncbi:MAG: hypothetical protein M1814_006854 [Vezdaea aestivalis]|nr:MAG: hypothetical protein M1814_006854 [Vezdaea aestivalis]